MDGLIIDRFEGDIAVCEKEDLSTIDIPRNQLPKGAKEGDCLAFDGKSYSIDAKETAARAKRIKEKMDSLFTD